MVTDVPIRIEVAHDQSGDGSIHLDFTGTDPQVGAALNVPSDGARTRSCASALFGYFITSDPDIPKSGSCCGRSRMTLPEGSVVNPEFPGACGVRFAHRAPPLRRGAGRPRPGAARPSAGGAGRRDLAGGRCSLPNPRPAGGTSPWSSR